MLRAHLQPDVILRPIRRLTLGGYSGFLVIGANNVLIPALLRTLEPAFGQTDAAVGLLFLLASLVYAVGAWGGGLLTARRGRQTLLRGAQVALALGLLGAGLAPTWGALPVNLGAGALDGGINALFLDRYRGARGGALNGLHVFSSLGSLLAPFCIGALLTEGGSWRLVVGGVGLCALLPALLVGRPAPRAGQGTAPPPRASGEEQGQPAPVSWVPFAGLAVSIGLYVAAEVTVSNWLVKLLIAVPLATATNILAVFWAGLTVGRLISQRLAERVNYVAFAIACMVGASALLFAAVTAPWLPLAVACFGLAGVCYGPIYPMIVALGGTLYPRHLAQVSGGLGTAAIAGGTLYPALMGPLAARVGLPAGMVRAAGLGLPMALDLVGAARAHRQVTARHRQATGVISTAAMTG